jgi:hypothetical protein
VTSTTARHRSAEPRRPKIIQINAEVKALATGDPRILEKAKLDAEVTRLERLERSHTRSQRALSATITAADQQLAKLQGERDQAAEAATRAIDTGGDRFSMTVNGTRWTSRADAAIALRNALAAVGSLDRMPGTSWDKPHHVATIGGFTVDATPRRLLQPHLILQLAGVPRSGITVDYDELRSDRPIGIITRLENRADDVDRLIVRIDTEISGLSAEADRARSHYSQPFTHRDALAVARQRSAELTEQLARTDDDTATPAPTSTGAEAAPTPVIATSADEQSRSPAPNVAHDRVTTRPPNDSGRWLSVGAYPTGTEVSVHSADADGPGRQLGHGMVVGHTGPEHVIVESPWGTRRTATLRCVRPTAPATQRLPAADSAPTTRWAALLDQQHPTVTADPHWPALAALLDRIDRAGGDVPALIDHVTRDRGLPTDNPARSLDYRLSDTLRELPRTDGQPYEPSTTAMPPPPPPAWPSRPTTPPGITPPR